MSDRIKTQGSRTAEKPFCEATCSQILSTPLDLSEIKDRDCDGCMALQISNLVLRKDVVRLVDALSEKAREEREKARASQNAQDVRVHQYAANRLESVMLQCGLLVDSANNALSKSHEIS